MPIPPPSAYRPSNLTKQQQKEALAACYGVSDMPTEQLSASEIERMRHILAQHDSESKKTSIHDLNNPPRASYQFKKFPMMVYDLGNSYPSHDEQRPKANSLSMETVHVAAKVISATVHSEEQLQEAIAGGWSEDAPTFSEEREEYLSTALANEASAVDAQIEEQRAKRPYNRKAA